MKNSYTYTVTTEPAIKLTVTITRRQLWNNFVESWKDIAWDEYHGLDSLKEVADVLLDGSMLGQSVVRVRRLFRDGWTVMLMGVAMDKLDDPNNKNMLREIVIQDVNEVTGEVEDTVFVFHEDIEF
jgi:hypothetical protein